ncbi:MAG: hypothetical protein Q9207_000813 [Kuettlingeria erythrocarpa]
MAYRTEDRAVLQEDGALELLGRIAGDAQVKLRGIRIEMEDIESTILRREWCSVRGRGDFGSCIIPIGRIPLSAHGKIDRRAVAQLPNEKSTIIVKATGDLNAMELQMRDIWLSVLPEQISQLHPVGAHSDFFEVGGNSMLLIKL